MKSNINYGKKVEEKKEKKKKSCFVEFVFHILFKCLIGYYVAGQ